jgi:hypothetical protein
MTESKFGGERVYLLSVLFRRPWHKHAELLRRRHAGAEDQLITDAAFVLFVVKV